MGHAVWDGDSRETYRAFSDTAKSATHVREVFKSTQINEALNPKGILLRESCDSKHNPESNAIIVGLDVTGSMGIIAHTMAKEGLGTLVEGILDRKPVVDPHIMFMAIGDARGDDAPLQVSQFEADIRIAQQLQDIYVEGHGGGNNTESYDLPWYFAANKTKIDCFEKRGKKGYLFTIGDEMPPVGLTKTHIKSIFGSDDQRGYNASELLAMAEEKYNVFHVIVEQGNFARRDPVGVVGEWRQLLGKRAIPLSNYEHISQVILSAIEVQEGADPEDVLASWQDAAVRKTVKHALFD